METKLKVTNANDEVSFNEIFSGDNVINIPLFQRAYRWKSSQFDDLWADALDIVEGKIPSQFLGVLVTVPQPWQLGRPRLSDVVDGQQRLTTCYIVCLAIAEVLAEQGEINDSVEIAKKLLLNRAFSTSPHNTKIVPSASDRAQFAALWDAYAKVVRGKSQSAWVGFGEPCPPAPSGENNGPLAIQYGRIKKRVSGYHSEYGKERLMEILNIFASNLSFVTISLVDPSAAPKIFERLNARGEKITTADLVRNEIFARVSDDPTRAQAIFSNRWEPMLNRFSEKNLQFDKYLFPYGLCVNENATKSDLFKILRSHWSTINNVNSIIDDLMIYQDTFFALECGVSQIRNHPLYVELGRLHRMQAPSSVYPFVFKLIDKCHSGLVDITNAKEVLLVIESFLFRRAICGIEPTGLHSVFKGLWSELVSGAGSINREAVSQCIRRRTTIIWPNDDEFERNIMSGELYRRNIKSFALQEFEASCVGETPSDGFEIEHIMPKVLTAGWDVSEADHKRLVNTWANLTPITREMNPAVGQAVFAEKRRSYRESIFATTRLIAGEHDNWGVSQITQRGLMISTWAKQRWPLELPS